jgi:hypothetical protein
VVANAATPGTSLNKLAKLSGSSALIAGTGDTAGIEGIVVSGAGITGSNAFIAVRGIALCAFDNSTTAGDYVQISTSSAGECHDVGSSRNSVNGQVIGQAMATSSGNVNVLLNPDTIAPIPTTLFSASSTTGRQLASGGTVSIATTDNGAGSTFVLDATNLCSKTSTGDQLSFSASTLPGTFSTTCTIPASVLGVGSVIEVYAAGIFTTGSGTPLMNFDIKIGSNVQVPAAATNLQIQTSTSNTPWILQGRISIASSTPTAIGSGSFIEQSSLAPGGQRGLGTNGAVSIVTSSSQTLQIDETATGVSGQTMNLQQLIVRIYK